MLSGTSSSGEHHFGVLEGWFGAQWWNSRFFVLLVTTLLVFTPLATFKRVGKCSCALSLDALDRPIIGGTESKTKIKETEKT